MTANLHDTSPLSLLIYYEFIIGTVTIKNLAQTEFDLCIILVYVIEAHYILIN